MDYTDIVLPFKSPYTDCTVYCHNIDSYSVDLINHVMSFYWEKILEYIKSHVSYTNGNQINKNYKNFIKYIIYTSSLDPDFICCAIIVLKDNYNLIINENKVSLFTLFINQDTMKCELGNIYNI